MWEHTFLTPRPKISLALCLALLPSCFLCRHTYDLTSFSFILPDPLASPLVPNNRVHLIASLLLVQGLQSIPTCAYFISPFFYSPVLTAHFPLSSHPLPVILRRIGPLRPTVSPARPSCFPHALHLPLLIRPACLTLLSAQPSTSHRPPSRPPFVHTLHLVSC